MKAYIKWDKEQPPEIGMLVSTENFMFMITEIMDGQRVVLTQAHAAGLVRNGRCKVERVFVTAFPDSGDIINLRGAGKYMVRETYFDEESDMIVIVAKSVGPDEKNVAMANKVIPLY